MLSNIANKVWNAFLPPASRLPPGHKKPGNTEEEIKAWDKFMMLREFILSPRRFPPVRKLWFWCENYVANDFSDEALDRFQNFDGYCAQGNTEAGVIFNNNNPADKNRVLTKGEAAAQRCEWALYFSGRTDFPNLLAMYNKEKKRSHHLRLEGSWQGSENEGGQAYLMTVRLNFLTGLDELKNLKVLGGRSGSELGNTGINRGSRTECKLVEGSIEWQLMQCRRSDGKYYEWMQTQVGHVGVELVMGKLYYDVSEDGTSVDNVILRFVGYGFFDPDRKQIRGGSSVQAMKFYSHLGVDDYRLQLTSSPFGGSDFIFRGTSRNKSDDMDPNKWPGLCHARITASECSNLFPISRSPNYNSAVNAMSSDNLDEVVQSPSGDIGGMCTICLDSYVHKVRAPCGHAFCAACICEHLLHGRPDVGACPICRQTLTTVSLVNCEDGKPLLKSPAQ